MRRASTADLLSRTASRIGLLFALLLALCAAPASAQIALRASSSAGVPTLPQLRAAGTLAFANNGNVTPALPAGTAAGDFLLCLVESRDNVAHALPAGWTQIAQQSSGASHQASLWWKTAGSAEAAPTVTHSGGSLILARTVGFYGVDVASPLLAAPTFTASPSDQTTEGTGYTVSVAGVPWFTWVFTAHIAESYNTYAIGAGGPFTQLFASVANDGNTRASLAAYYDTRAAGAQPNVVHNNNPPAPRDAVSHGALLALRPAAAGGLTIPVPAGTLPGDAMVAIVAVAPHSATLTPPAGWTQVNGIVNPSGSPASLQLASFVRVAGASEPAGYTWTFSGTIGGAVGGMLSFSGVDSSAPIDQSGQNATGSSFSHNAASITTTADNAMLLSAHAFTSSTSGFTPPATMTEAVDITSLAGPNPQGVGMEVNLEQRGLAGATGNRVAVANATGIDAGYGAALMIALRPAAAVSHYLVQNNPSGVNCQAESISITPHNATHDAVSLNNTRTITLTARFVAGAGGPGNRGDWSIVSGGGTLSNGVADDGVATYTFAASGESNVVLALKNTWAQTVNIAVSDGSATDISGTASADVGYNQDLTFNPAGFRFVDAADNLLPSQVAGIGSSTLRLQAIESTACSAPGACTGACAAAPGFASGTSVSVDLASECVNPGTCQPGQQASITNNGTSAIAANNSAAVSAYTSKLMQFGANAVASFTLSYPDVGAIRLHARYTIPLGGGGTSPNIMTGASNAFVVKPYSFRVSNVLRDSDAAGNPAASDATGPAFIQAGASFRATVTAVNFAGSATPNFGRETTPEGARLISTLVSGLGLANNPALANASAFGAFSGGAASGTTFSWPEVGIITLGARVADGDYLGAGDAAALTQSGNVGRFTPHHFALSGATLTNRVAAACAPASSFTYMGEGIGLAFTLTARSAAGSTTRNYVTSGAAAGNFAKLPSTAGGGVPPSMGWAAVDGTTDLSARLDASSASAITWAAGVANVTATVNLARAASVDGPYAGLAIGIAPLDADGIGLQVAAYDLNVDGAAGNDHARVGTTEVRFGRLRVHNALGSELAALFVPLEVQYFNGIGFAVNAADGCTSLQRSDVIMRNYTRNLGACETGMTTPPATLGFAAGRASLPLTAPGAGNDGSVDLNPRLTATDTGSVCLNGVSSAATTANRPWLQFNWGGGASFNQNPTGRAAFGLSRKPAELIYFREVY
jgi:hypothetical protein